MTTRIAHDRTRSGRRLAARLASRLAAAVLVLVPAAPLACHAPAPASDLHGQAAPSKGDTFTWHGRIAPGDAIEIKNVNGDVRAVAAPGEEVEVTASKTGKRSDPSEVRIEVLQHEDGVTICAVYPDAGGRPANACGPGEEGHMNTRNNDVQVVFTLRVPARVRFVGQSVNGDVTAEGLGSAVLARTVNGSVRVSTAAYAEASTVNGSIDASLGRADWSDALEFTTVNGPIDLRLPAELDTEVRLETLNGEISTDFPLESTRRLSRRRVTGTIGQGGRELRLESVNGNIRLRRTS